MLRAVTDLTPSALTAGLRALDSRYLTTTGEHDVRLRHPLLAEAARRRLVAGEAIDGHRRLALALAREPDPSSAEVAEHWRCAVEPANEIAWRIRAARDARSRFAAAQEAEHWQRALVLWPDDADVVGTPGLRKADAYVSALEALEHIDWPAAAAVADEALASLTESQGSAAAAVYQRAGVIRGKLGDPAAGLALVDRALDIFDAERHPAERARALLNREYLLSGLDRLDEAAAACLLASELVADQYPVTARAALVGQAVHAAESGRFEEALEHIRAAAGVNTPEADPGGDLYVALTHTHLLLTAGRGADDVVTAGQPGLKAAQAGGSTTSVRRCCRETCPKRCDRPAGCRRRHGSSTRSPRSCQRRTTGRPTASVACSTCSAADATKRPGGSTAWQRCSSSIWPTGSFVHRTHPPPILVRSTAARVRPAHHDTPGLRGTRGQGADVAGILGSPRGQPPISPRLPRPRPGCAPPCSAARRPRGEYRSGSVRHAQCQRQPPGSPRDVGCRSRPPVGDAVVELWAAAAAAWDKIVRPHDSAYCRWRGAQVAFATEQASAARKLLRRAERDAREHMPLLDRIRRVPRSP